jgi:hypothetical protein
MTKSANNSSQENHKSISSSSSISSNNSGGSFFAGPSHLSAPPNFAAGISGSPESEKNGLHKTKLFPAGFSITKATNPSATTTSGAPETKKKQL